MNLFTHNKVIKIFALILVLLPSISMAGKHDDRGHDNDRQNSVNDSGSQHKRKQHGRGHDSERHFSKHERRQQRRQQRRHNRKHYRKYGHHDHYDRHEYHYDRHHRNNHHDHHYAVVDHHRPHRAYQNLRFLFGLHRGAVDIHYGY